MPAIDIQLAIQGGGAKIVALMAAMEAVDELQKKSQLRVTRIAGTSAGALVGAIYASKPNAVAEARVHLERLTPKQVRRQFPSPFSPGNSVRLAKLLLLGHPFWKTDEIENLLVRLLQNDQTNFRHIKELNTSAARNIELKVVSTNLSASSKRVHSEADELIHALMSSAGLPYFFRTWTRSGNEVVVDGGICENLPSDELDQPNDVKKYGRIVGLTFEPPKVARIDNIADFSTSLLETAMQNSMQRARQRLGESNIFQIQTDIETFEFEKAVEILRNGGSSDYKLVRKQTSEWFEDFIKREQKERTTGSQVSVGDPWGTQGLAMMDKLGEVYLAQHANRPREFSFCSLEVRARCLAPEGSGDYNQPDVVKYSTTFRVKSEPIFCQRICVSGTMHESQIRRTKWSLIDLSQKTRIIKTIDLPMRTAGAKPSKDRELLIFLDPPLAPESGPYQFEFEDLILGFMKPLSQGTKDDLFYLSSPSQGIIKRIDLVLHIPTETPPIVMTPRNGNSGRAMTPQELDDYYTPIGYRTMGWTSEDVIGGKETAVDLNYLE